MADKPFDLKQNIFKEDHPPIRVFQYQENALTEQILQDFLDTAPGGTVGMAPTYGSKCVLKVLAISSASRVLLVRLSSQKKKKSQKNKHTGISNLRRVLLEDTVLCHPGHTKFAFKMDRLSAALHMDFNLRISNGVDLLSASKSSRRSLDSLMSALGGEATLHKPELIALFKQEENASAPARNVALQAWAAWRAGSLPSMTKILAKIPRINTQIFQDTHLDFLAKTLRDADRLDAMKPTKVKNDVEAKFSQKSGNLNVSSTRYKTRVVQALGRQTLQIETTLRGKRTTVTGRASKVNGRAAMISVHGAFHGGEIRSIYTIGKEEPTSAEGQRASIILKALQRSKPLSWRDSPSQPCPPLYFPQRQLNSSQSRAVREILSNDDAHRITVIHGPPGTGKTTVIAAAVKSITVASCTRTMWLIAHSNVAVKNIAEKLAEVDFLDFKLLVSKDFHFDWHEHLYGKIERNVVRSDSFPEDTVSASRLLLGSRVTLCTLSMLSNQKISLFARFTPVETVIVDEASQIDVGDYIPMLHRFEPTLRKLVFIGDDLQLAPYGQEDIDDLQSIFEMPIRDRAIFLDTQYRMPTPIGNFISRYVYGNRLKTVHEIHLLSSCRLVDVHHGRERSKGNSWVNIEEIQAVTRIARKYSENGNSYRVITPYDAQRSELEKALKSEKLPWEDKCFNVDSFQGNEEDHIIISLVRSDKIGFLKNTRRTNVMLTRCKRSMIICTSRAFLESDAARTTLVRRLATTLGSQAWLSWSTVLSGSF